jgi:hypothetical protein
LKYEFELPRFGDVMGATTGLVAALISWFWLTHFHFYKAPSKAVYLKIQCSGKICQALQNGFLPHHYYHTVKQ